MKIGDTDTDTHIQKYKKYEKSNNDRPQIEKCLIV